MPWQGFNGLDVLQFTVVHVLRKHGALSCALPAQLLNGFSNYAYLQEFFFFKKKQQHTHTRQSEEKNWFTSFVRKTYNILNIFNKGTAAETGLTCCRYISHLQYANANLSLQTHNCRNSITGHSSITLQSSSVWIMVTVTAHRRNSKTSTIHHWTMFATKTTRTSGCVPMPVGPRAIVSKDEW